MTGFLLSLIVAYFIRLWALDNGHEWLSTLATIYMFIILFPIVIGLLILISILLFLIFKFLTAGRKNRKPFWYKNKTWTK
jgi:hypothetical protein